MRPEIAPNITVQEGHYRGFAAAHVSSTFDYSSVRPQRRVNRLIKQVQRYSVLYIQSSRSAFTKDH